MIFFKNKPPIIQFHATAEDLDCIPHPVPAYKKMPEWYKKLKPEMSGRGKAEKGTVKRCVPVLDAVSQGYIIPLWADLQVQVAYQYEFANKEGNVTHIEPTLYPNNLLHKEMGETGAIAFRYRRLDNLGVMMRFPENSYGADTPLGGHSWQQVGEACTLNKFKFGKFLLKLINPWTIETRKGYSVQFKNPSNDWSNDICIIEGVVDTDTFYSPINFPYVWTGNQEGEYIIPQGTPIVHVIPFKREKHDYSVGLQNFNKRAKINNIINTKFFDNYKTHFWHKRKK